MQAKLAHSAGPGPKVEASVKTALSKQTVAQLKVQSFVGYDEFNNLS